MPPVDRLQPTRGKSSESTCSLMEFMREFPDDNAWQVTLDRGTGVRVEHTFP